MQTPRISVVIPAYNEEECVEDCVTEVCGVMDGVGQTCEVIVVDDGSSDGTADRLRALKPRFPQLRILRLLRNSGETAAMAAGFERARGEIIATLDADLQNDPADLPRMLKMLDECDVVCGIRAKREDSWLKRISSRIGNGFRNRLTHDDIVDVGCTIRVMRAQYVKRVKLFTGMHRFLPTLLKMEGARVTQMAVNHRPRLKGKSKYGVWNRLFRGLNDVMAVRWMKSRRLRHEIKEEL